MTSALMREYISKLSMVLPIIFYFRSFAGTVDALIKLRFNFSNARGAFLVVHRAKTIRVPDEFLKVSNKLQCLQGRMLVTGIVTCPGYVRYLSAKSMHTWNQFTISKLIHFSTESESVGVALTANSPVGVVPGASVGGGMALKWKTSTISGNMQNSYHDEATYTPLFYAKQILQPMWRRIVNRRRDSPDPNEPKDD